MSKVVIGDADALMALVLEKDPHHKKAIAISRKLAGKGVAVIFPITVFPEAITSLKRAASQPEKAQLINKQLKLGAYRVEYLTEEILQGACKIFDNVVSKQNTFFDAIVAATAESLGTDVVFSFDNWYPKLGLRLAA